MRQPFLRAAANRCDSIKEYVAAYAAFLFCMFGYWESAIVQTGIFCNPFPEQVFIFVRKTLQVRPRDQKSVSFFTARREGSAFFDEDDAGVGFRYFAATCLNYCGPQIKIVENCV